MNDNLLEIKNLSVEYRTYDGVVKALNQMNLTLPRGKTLGLVGETGAGKTTTALAIMGLVPNPPGVVTSGEILFECRDLNKVDQKEFQKVRGNQISMIFQNPMTSLNPVYAVGHQLTGIITLHQNLSKKDAEKKAGDMLEIVGIPRSRAGNYPHEFSGGMKQRVCIAMGLACNPNLLIADEPTTALDVTIQAQILDLIRELKREFNTSTIFITHALGVVREIADDVAVVYAGSILEKGSLKEIFTNPRHPYTLGLFGCLPDSDCDQNRLNLIRGSMPDPLRLPEGCKFRTRCDYATDKCGAVEPEVYDLTQSHQVKCHLYEGDAING